MNYLLKLSLLAKAISVIFLPPLVSLWFFIIFAFYSPVGLSTSPLYMAGVGITFFTILPLLTLVLLARGHGPTFAVPQSSRHLSYVIVFFEYIIGTLIFYLGKAIILFVIGIIYIAIIVALMIINLFWKISVHAAGISGPATFCIYIFGPVTIWAFPLIMFVLLVLWARWRLQAHTVSQLVGGTMVASIITLLISYISF